MECAICEHPGYGEINRILANHIDLPTPTGDLTLAINAVLKSISPAWQELSVAEVEAHRRACAIVITPEPSLRIENRYITLTGGRQVKIVSPSDALASIAAIGLDNVLRNPESVTAAQTVRALEALAKIGERRDEMDEIRKRLAELLAQGTPGVGPYAGARPQVKTEEIET